MLFNELDDLGAAPWQTGKLQNVKPGLINQGFLRGAFPLFSGTFPIQQQFLTVCGLWIQAWHYWLVVYESILKNVSSFIGLGLSNILWKIKFMFQTTNQYILAMENGPFIDGLPVTLW